MEKTIVAIGGGELADLETLKIDQEIVRLTGKDHPKALFIPTASGDAPGYIQTFDKVYGDKLGCQVDQLLLVNQPPNLEQITDQILSSDLIYVGGGNTLAMLKRWRKLGVDKVLEQAYQKGIILSGLSAGSVCWFEFGHSDSGRFKNPNQWQYIRLKALGLLPGIHTPHYHHEKREQSFAQAVRWKGGVGIALDNNVALEVVGEQYRIITSNNKTGGAFKVYRRQGQVVTEPIEQSNEFKSVAQLFGNA